VTPQPTPAKTVLTGIFHRLRSEGQILLLIWLLILVAAFFSVTTNRFLTVPSITSMAFQVPEIGVMTLGMMITMIVGGINLAIVDTANLSALMAGLFLVKVVPHTAAAGQMPLYIGIALLIALTTGCLCGALNGLFIGYIGVSPILATLATLTIFRGICVGITGGKTLTGFPVQLSVIGHAKILGIPIPLIILVVAAVVIHVILKRTSFGFQARMMGTNPTASNFSGINNKSINMKLYILSGILGAVAGIILMSRLNSVAYEYGTRTYILLTILISVMSGVSDGFGSVLALILSVFILQMLSTGFHMLLRGMSGSAFFKDFSWGALLIIFFIIQYSRAGKTAKE
jgi:simple sugar transport system permease protein